MVWIDCDARLIGFNAILVQRIIHNLGPKTAEGEKQHTKLQSHKPQK